MEKILIFIFLFYGLVNLLIGRKIEIGYIGILLFFLLKMITNYRKCTISYIECKLRNVKKEKGYLNKCMDSILNLRDSSECGFIYIYSLIILSYHFTLNTV